MARFVSDYYGDPKEFKRVLSDAITNAETEFEEEFTTDMEERFLDWGMRMLLSDKQHEVLLRIANKE